MSYIHPDTIGIETILTAIIVRPAIHCSQPHSDCSKIGIPENNQASYTVVRHEIIKFIKECYLKNNEIKYYLDFVGFSFADNGFGSKHFNLAKKLEEFSIETELGNHPYNVCVMIMDVIKLLCLALPQMFCIILDARGNSMEQFRKIVACFSMHVVQRKTTTMSHLYHTCHFLTNPEFNFYRIPTLNSTKEFKNMFPEANPFSKSTVDPNISNFINKVRWTTMHLFDCRRVLSRQTYLTPKQRLVVWFLIKQLKVLDVVNVICDLLYIVIRQPKD